MKKLRKYIYIIIAMSTLASCNDWLSVQPEDDVIRERFWTTKEDVNSALMGCYAAMMDKEAMTRFVIWGEMRADMVTPAAKAGQNEVSMQDGEISATNKYCSWNAIYAVINNCNTVLEFAPQVQKVDQSFSDKLLQQYQAEAICIRSLMYFYLVRTFGDVPYITTASLNDQQEYSVPKKNKDEIIKELIASLEALKSSASGTNQEVMVEDFGTNKAVNKGRFTRYGMRAILADIYLWNEDYANCNAICNEIINSGKYKLEPIARTVIELDGLGVDKIKIYEVSEGDADAFFTNVYVTGNSTESIFELQFAEDYQTPLNSFFHQSNLALGAKIDNMVETFFIPSLYNVYWQDIRGNGISYRQSYVWKWIGLDRNLFSLRAYNESFSNWIFYRLSDVHLMKAEALTQLGMQNEANSNDLFKEALAQLTIVRDRGNATETTQLIASDETVIDGKTLEEFILLERGRELAFEGKRWFDVLRHAKRNNYGENNIQYLIDLAVLAANPNKVTSLQNKWRSTPDSHYLPIAQSELETNTKLVQNPFYAH